MIRIHFVGDGPRDVWSVPHLVEGILSHPVELAVIGSDQSPQKGSDKWSDQSRRHWARLNSEGSGYRRKLLFAIRTAKDEGADGLVAVVDRDKTKDNSRLNELVKTRNEDRQKTGHFPTAIGEAIPHGDVWLLDDPVAVRRGLDLAPSTEIVNVRRSKYPKDDLDDLIANAPRSEQEAEHPLTSIARLVDASRCAHARETGFQAFVDEVRTEFGPLVASGK